MPNDDHQMRISHVQAASYKIAPIDSAIVTMMTDPLGTTLSLTMTRLDGLPSVEIVHGTVKSDEKGLVVQGAAKSTFEGTLRKVQEFTAVLRPDRAFEIAQVIINNLAQLPLEERERYQLPNFQSAPSNEGQDTDDQ